MTQTRQGSDWNSSVPDELQERFEALDIGVLQQHVEERTPEDLHLDFKILNDASFTQEDKVNLAKSLSGFANSDGGLLIWGVDARRDEVTNIDGAARLSPIANVALAHSRLIRLSGEALVPRHAGVRHRRIDQGDGSGYLVSIVPASSSPPHMAKLGVNCYYKRSGDSFYMMEHFDIADAFGRRPQPRLRLYWSLHPGGIASGGGEATKYSVSAVFGIQNDGGGIARFPYLRLLVEKPHALSTFGLDGNRRNGLPTRPLSGRSSLDGGYFVGGADDVIHPGTLLEVTCVRVEFAETRLPRDLVVSFSLGAAEHRPIDDTLVLQGDLLSSIGRRERPAVDSISQVAVDDL